MPTTTITAQVYRRGHDRAGLLIHGPVVVLTMSQGDRHISMMQSPAEFRRMMEILAGVADRTPIVEEAPAL